MSKHDQLQAAAYQWAQNRYPQIRGHLFAARSEVIRYPGETEKQFLARLGHLKSIGHRKGILDLHLDMPKTDYMPGAPYEFDSKILPDYLKPDQVDRVAMMRRCGGNGWAFYSLDEFKMYFELIMVKHFDKELVIEEPKCVKFEVNAEAKLRKQRIEEMRRSI